jgi:hypothetical protein
VEAADALIQAGANANAANRMTGATPLHMVAQSSKATRERRLAVVALLLAAGADPSQADQRGSVPADLVADPDPDLQAALAPHPPALVQAIHARKVAAVRACVAEPEYLEDPNVPFRDQTPTSRTVQLLCSGLTDQKEDAQEQADALVEILQLLLQTPGTVIPPDDDSPLLALLGALQAVEEDDSWETRVLHTAISLFVAPIRRQPDVIPPDGWQLLQRAARRDDLPFLTFLVEDLHMDPNTKGRQGMTALQFAARSGKLSVLVRTNRCRRWGAPVASVSHPLPSIMSHSYDLIALLAGTT